MTRKSPQRIERDLEAKRAAKAQTGPQQSPPRWEELEALHVEASRSVLTLGAVTPLIGNVDFQRLVKDPDELLRYSNLLLKDSTEFKNRLQAIHAQHTGRTGVVSADDIMELIMIGESYSQWLTEWATVVVPSIEAITNMASEITDEYNAAKAVSVEGEVVKGNA